MMSFRPFALLAAIPMMLSVPAWADSPDGVDCMQQSYSTEQLAQIDTLTRDPTFNGFGAERSPASEALFRIGLGATQTCRVIHDWSESQSRYALLYEGTRLAELALRQTGGLDAQELQQFDDALVESDTVAIFAMFERQLRAAIEGDVGDTTLEEEELIRPFVRSAGIRADAPNVDIVGILIGAMVTQRIAKREFAALIEGS